MPLLAELDLVQWFTTPLIIVLVNLASKKNKPHVQISRKTIRRVGLISTRRMAEASGVTVQTIFFTNPNAFEATTCALS